MYIRYPGATSASISFPLNAPDGSAAAPSYSFSSSPSTGMYYSATQLNFSVSGTLRFSISATAITPTIPFLAPDGSVSAPSYANSTGKTGLYFGVGEVLNFTSNQALVGSINASGKWTIGASGSVQTTIVNSQALQLVVSTKDFRVVGNGNDGYVQYQGGASTDDGAVLRLYGSTHASFATTHQFYSAGTLTGAINASGAWTLGASAGVQTLTVNHRVLALGCSSSSPADLTVTNTNSASGSAHARLNLSVGGGSAGDPYIELDISGGSSWSLGTDNSDSDSFCLVNASSLTGTNTMKVTTAGSVILNSAAIATNATDGFLYIASCAGTPTGVPTSNTGRVPMVYDTTANKIWFYNGSWRGVVVA